MNRRRAALPRIALALLLVALAASTGCIQNLGRQPAWGKPSTLLFDLDESVAIPERPVVIFFADGINKTVFEELLVAGELPHIKHYLVDRGVSIQDAVTSLPTVTLCQTTTYATGRVPGHHGILGNKWFDPTFLECQDYTTIATMRLINDDIEAPTIYELLDREESMVVLTQVNRGATVYHENFMRVGPAWFFGMYRNVQLSTTARLQNAVARASKVGHWPDLITLYYPATDEVAHKFGHTSDTYRDMIRVLDGEIGDACKAFEAHGFLDRTLLVLVTDHGMQHSEEHTNVACALRDAGLKVWTDTLNEQWGDWRKRYDKLADRDAAVTVDADRFAKLYFHVPGFDWAHRPSLDELAAFPVGGVHQVDGGLPNQPVADRINLVELALGLPATGFAAYSDRAAGTPTVTIFTDHSISQIARLTAGGAAPVYRYRVLSGQTVAGISADGHDPLGYLDHPPAAMLIDGAFHSANAWFEATAESAHPDFVAQLPAMFDHRRAGDLCLFARAGWDFGATNVSGHGGLTRDETVVPMIFAGGGLPEGTTLHHASTSALVPTVVEFIRAERDPAIFRNFDADSLLDKLRHAGQNVASRTAVR